MAIVSADGGRWPSDALAEIFRPQDLIFIEARSRHRFGGAAPPRDRCRALAPLRWPSRTRPNHHVPETAEPTPPAGATPAPELCKVLRRGMTPSRKRSPRAQRRGSVAPRQQVYPQASTARCDVPARRPLAGLHITLPQALGLATLRHTAYTCATTRRCTDGQVPEHQRNQLLPGGADQGQLRASDHHQRLLARGGEMRKLTEDGKAAGGFRVSKQYGPFFLWPAELTFEQLRHDSCPGHSPG
jgi:hypothetical protein